MKLLFKGLLLVTVPLVFEVGFVAMLIHQNNEIEEQRTREQHSKEVIAAMYAVSDNFVTAASEISIYKDGGGLRKGDKTHLLRASKAIDELPALAAQASALVPQSDELSDTFDQARRAQRYLVAIRDALLEDKMLSMETLLTIDVLRTRVTALMPDFTDAMHKFIHKERLLSNKSEEQQTIARAQFQQILWLGISGNVLLAVALAAWMNVTTVRRLKRVQQNATNIGAEVALLPELTGDDEIGHLDRVLHEVSRALDAAKEQERELERIKEEFYAMITHDLRSPLASVMMGLQMTTQEVFGQISPDYMKILQMAERNTCRMARLVDDLLDLKKLESGKFELNKHSEELDEIVSSAVEVVKEQAAKRNISIVVEEGQIGILADSQRIEQVLVNLLSNSIKFSPDEGKIVVRTSHRSDGAMVEVIDQGPGIPDAMKASIFEKFTQTENESRSTVKGTGLGLAVCKLVVEQHGGKVGISDNPEGEGSVFWFTIPNQSDLAVITSEIGANAVPQPSGRKD